MVNNRAPELRAIVADVVERTPVFDIHTHLYDPAFGDLLLWGIDDSLVYHYLVAEGFRQFDWPCEKFWSASKTDQADAIWQALFLGHSPISEACRGVLTSLQALGFDAKQRDLPALRAHFAKWKTGDFVDHCLTTANVRQICMTNSPFDESERTTWLGNEPRDSRFVAGLRIDPLLLDWENSAVQLHGWGYDVRADFSGETFAEVRRFLAEWTTRMDARYCMVSLPPDFAFPSTMPVARLIEHAVLPHGREHNQAFAMMMGVKRLVNPQLRMAGDASGLADITAVQNLCAGFPENKFLCTMLARENQHELCVTARKFRNLHIFGCWWFLNTPSLIEEITRLRIELLGLSFTPQHSDARVLDQLVYKWQHTRGVLAKVLGDKYADLAATGWEPTRAEIERDVREFFGGALERFLAK